MPDMLNLAHLLRLGPGLTREQVEILASAPYEQPKKFKLPGLLRRALVLKALGLLEEDPGTPGIFRCTELGHDVVLAYKAKGWLP